MSKGTILVVEDEPVSAAMLESILQSAGYRTILCENGAAAWDALQDEGARLDAILLDRNLPDTDGLSLLARIKAETHLQRIPVIFETALDSQADVLAGLQAGAHYYVTKPFDPAALLAIVHAAVSDYNAFREVQQSLRESEAVFFCMLEAEFEFRTLKQAHDVATLLCNSGPYGQRAIMGLVELMLNAVEHGNLEISYAEKSRLLDAEDMHEEIKRRLDDPRFSARKARVRFERDEREVRFIVTDEGPGFEWADYLEISPERAFDSHGRGIAMARMISFDQIEYRGRGNQVVARVLL